MNSEFQQLSDDDLQALMQIAGPLYAESRSIEKSIIDNPDKNSLIQDGSMKIKKGLEQVERLVQVSKYQNNPPPPPPNYPVHHDYNNPPMVGYPPNIPPPTITPPHNDSNQMEFNFDAKGLLITNDLLKDISSKMSKILKLLETHVKV